MAMSLEEIKKWLQDKNRKSGDKVTVEPTRPSGSEGVHSITKVVVKR